MVCSTWQLHSCSSPGWDGAITGSFSCAWESHAGAAGCFLLVLLGPWHTPALTWGQQAEHWAEVGLGATFAVYVWSQSSAMGGGEPERAVTHRSEHLCGSTGPVPDGHQMQVLEEE